MSAHVCIQWAHVPQHLIDTSRQRIDGVTGAQVVSFEECPYAGEIEQTHGDEPKLQVQFPLPRNHMQRNLLIDWLLYHGMSFVVMAA